MFITSEAMRRILFSPPAFSANSGTRSPEKDESGEDILVTVDDDDEFADVADFFDDMLSDEADYDVNTTK